MTIDDVTRQAVLRALEECRTSGEEVFLKRYGFGPSREYFVLYDGVSYPSKAIVGAAHGYAHPGLGPLSAADFSGGDATVGRLLRRLGFEVQRRETAGGGRPRSDELIDRSPEMLRTSFRGAVSPAREPPMDRQLRSGRRPGMRPTTRSTTQWGTADPSSSSETA